MNKIYNYLLILTVLFCISSVALAQTGPGGVSSGLRVWLKADEGVVRNESNIITTWQDQSGLGNDYEKMDGNHPLYIPSTRYMNFNPSVNFRTENEYLSTPNGKPMSVDAPNYHTSFSIYYVDQSQFSQDEFYTHGFGATKNDDDTRYPALGVSIENMAAGTGVGRVRNSGSGSTNNDGNYFGFKTYQTSMEMIETRTRNAGSARIIYDFNGQGEIIDMGSNTFGTGFRMKQGGTVGGASSSSRSFKGHMGEFIVFEDGLSLADRAKVQSYLGLKYGITVDNNHESITTNFDYFLSDGTVVWPGTSSSIHHAFHNNVTGIFRDDVAEVNQTQSRSTMRGATLTIALEQVKDYLQDVPGTFQNNLTALVWGHNNVTGTKTVTSEECGDFTSKTSRVWLVQNTGESKTVQIAAYAEADSFASFPYNTGYEVSLLVGTDPTMNTYDQVIPGLWVDGKLLVNYTFPENSIRYISFGATYVGEPCESCTFSGTKKIEFTESTWSRGSQSNIFNLGDGFTAQVNVSIESPSEFVSRYPRSSTFKSLREYRRRGVGNNAMTTEVILSEAAAAAFEIFEIDRRYVRHDDVEVYGICNGSVVYPKLSYVDRESSSSYQIVGNHAISNNRTSSYTAKRGRMYVEFENAVEKIYVIHKYTGGPVTGRKRIGIGAMEFVCPAPLPDPTEDGLVFTKQGSTDVLLCEEVNYTFRISNTNCDPYPVNFSDVLPAGMKWVEGSLSVDDSAVSSATINEYGNTNTLNITGLEIPPTSTLTFRATAIFDMDATAGAYPNRGIINYESNVNPGTSIVLESCDRLTTGCEPTVTNASASDPPELIQTEIITDKVCFTAEGELEVTLSINNPNTFSISDMLLDIGFDDNFEYVDNSLESLTVNLGGATIEIDQGSIYVEDFELPSGNHTIKFKLKAPQEGSLYIGSDLLPVPLIIDYALESNYDDVCVGASLVNANGEIEIPYCTFCTQLPVGGDALTSSVGISTFKNQIEGWPQNVANGFLVLESSQKGMVLTRIKSSDIPNDKLVEGMIIYDTQDNCIKIYNGTNWNCIKRSCNE